MTKRALPKILLKEEVEALMRVPNLRAPTGLRNRCMLELMYRAGLRVGETCGLHVRDYRRADHQLHLRKEITKGKVEAYAYLDEHVEALLDRWLAARAELSRKRRWSRPPWLFATHAGLPVDPNYMNKAMNRYARRAGIDRRVGPHMLRHTFATQLLRSHDFDIREVQELLRHASVQTTMIYTHVYEAELQRKVRARKF